MLMLFYKHLNELYRSYSKSLRYFGSSPVFIYFFGSDLNFAGLGCSYCLAKWPLPIYLSIYYSFGKYPEENDQNQFSGPTNLRRLFTADRWFSAHDFMQTKDCSQMFIKSIITGLIRDNFLS